MKIELFDTVFNSVENAYALLTDKLGHWVEQAVLLVPNMITAVLIFLFFYLIGKSFELGLVRISRKYPLNREVVRILARILHMALVIVGLFYSLGVLHLDKTVTSLLAGAGIVGLALSFAFQDIATNFVSGFILALRKPFKADDLVETNGYFGRITQINLRAIHLLTFQGQEIIIPAKDVIQKPIKNYSSTGQRRIDIMIRVSFAEDLERVTEIAKAAIEKLNLRSQDLPVEVFCDEFGESSVNIKVWFWVDRINNQFFNTARHEAIIAIHKEFKANKIFIPFPIRTLDFDAKGGTRFSGIPGADKDSF
jgi:small conductance mechanosensitive channel